VGLGADRHRRGGRRGGDLRRGPAPRKDEESPARDGIRAQEVASLREQLAITAISRDAAVAEAAGLRAELTRLGSELAVTREQVDAGDGELGAAQQLLEDARALTAQLREESRS
jgi:hypothetical protein